MKNLSQISVILMKNLSHFCHLRLAGMLNGLKKMSVIVDTVYTQTIHHFTVPKWVDIVRNDLSR